jgi:hypothetical protein
MNTRLVYLAMSAAALVVAGCQKSEPTLPAPSPPAAPPPAAKQPATLPPGHPPIDMSAQALPPGATAQAINPQWTVPEGWQAGPPSSVRRASFAVKGPAGQAVDIAVTAFPGDVGGTLANVNRWRGQIGLAPLAQAEADKLTAKLDVNGVAATVVDFAGEKQRMIVATIPHGGNSWFFKMTGAAALVEAQKSVFLEFVKSVKF